MLSHLVAIKHSIASFHGGDADALHGLSGSSTQDRHQFIQAGFTPPGTMYSIGSRPTVTAEMALAESSLQDFLSQPEFDVSFLDNQIQGDQMQALYYPMLQEDGWMSV